MLSPNAKLTHYMSLAQSAAPAAAADICVRAAADPQLHVFGELLSAPSIAALPDTPHAGAHALLRLFAFGTYAQWAADTRAYPPLSAAHVRKLRALSLVTLAAGRAALPYDELLPALGLGSSRELEAFVLDVAASGLVEARVDQRRERLAVVALAARDVDAGKGAGDIERLRAVLKAWRGNTERVLKTLDERVAYVNAEAAKRANAERVQEDGEARARRAVKDEHRRKAGIDTWANEKEDDGAFAHGNMAEMDVPMATDAGLMELMTEVEPRLGAPTGFGGDRGASPVRGAARLGGPAARQ